MTKFLGQHRIRVDKKGRLFIPKKQVNQLYAKWGEDPKLILAMMGSQRCLTLVDKDSWFEKRQELEDLPWFEKNATRIRRLLGFAEGVELDQQKRIMLPPRLRGLAGIEPEQEVVVIGCGDYLEIWDAEAADQMLDELLGDADDLLESALAGPAPKPTQEETDADKHNQTLE